MCEPRAPMNVMLPPISPTALSYFALIRLEKISLKHIQWFYADRNFQQRNIFSFSSFSFFTFFQQHHYRRRFVFLFLNIYNFNFYFKPETFNFCCLAFPGNRGSSPKLGTNTSDWFIVRHRTRVVKSNVMFIFIWGSSMQKNFNIFNNCGHWWINCRNKKTRNSSLSIPYKSSMKLSPLKKGELLVKLTSLSGLGCFENDKKFRGFLETADAQPLRMRRSAVLIHPP